MKTSKVISTVSYNSKEFLTNFLTELFNNGNIQFWCAIYHLGEWDEDKQRDDKNHFHVYIEPNERIDTTQLQKMSCEFIEGYTKPLKCMDFRLSELDDWVWYELHDEAYLRTKFETKQYHYSREDFFTSEFLEEDLELRLDRALHSGKISELLKKRKMLDDYSANELAYMGYVAPKEAYYMRTYEDMVRRGALERKNNSTNTTKKNKELSNNCKQIVYKEQDIFIQERLDNLCEDFVDKARRKGYIQ